MSQGHLALILHAHLPFVRHPEYETPLEENWLFEAITDTYIPLLQMIETFVGQGIHFRLTLSISPTLASMLLDPLLQSRYLDRIERLIELSEKEIERPGAEAEIRALAKFYRDRFLRARKAFAHDYGCSLIPAFKRLQDLGEVEVLASAATHGYLPLLSAHEASVRAQIRVGIECYRRLFGRAPRGLWLPECGYYPGLEELLAEHGIRYAVLETHGITRARPRPEYGVYAPVLSSSGVAFFGRDPESARRVWSSKEGYPGDFDYREFYRDVAYDRDLEYIRPFIHPCDIPIDSGIKYYRITGTAGHKELYRPDRAERKAEAHASDFISHRAKEIKYLARVMRRSPVLAAPYDAELFGHWWYEGPDFLRHLIRKIALEQTTIRLTTLSEYLDEYPENQTAVPSASSWGSKGFNETWLNPKNDWIYPPLHAAGIALERLAAKYPRAERATLRALNQAARELLLAQASDWAFMMSAGPMTEYATRRVKTHLSSLFALQEQIESGRLDEAALSALERRNNLFPWLDYRSFA